MMMNFCIDMTMSVVMGLLLLLCLLVLVVVVASTYAELLTRWTR